MPTYVILYQFTDKGRRSIKSTVSRAAQTRRENERRGFKVIGTWWTQGEYDLITVVDAPSESAMMGALFNVAEAGNVSSVSMRAFTEAEMRRAFAAASATGGGTATRKRTTRKTAARKRTAAKRPARRKTTSRASATRKTAASRARSARKTAATRARSARKRTAAKRPARKTARRR